MFCERREAEGPRVVVAAADDRGAVTRGTVGSQDGSVPSAPDSPPPLIPRLHGATGGLDSEASTQTQLSAVDERAFQGRRTRRPRSRFRVNAACSIARSRSLRAPSFFGTYLCNVRAFFSFSTLSLVGDDGRKTRREPGSHAADNQQPAAAVQTNRTGK